MCFDFDASPPYLPSELALAPVAGGAATELLELTSTDGTSFSAALAPTAESKGPGVVILPDVRGLYPFYSELSERFAQAGHDAIAIDYFGRTAGLGPRDEKFDFWPHVQDSDPALIQQDAAAAVAAMRERAGVEKVVSVGFCFGGAQSLLAGTNAELGLDGVVAFYGALDGERLGIISPPDVVDQMRAPILGLYGGADQSIPVEAVDDFESKLDAAGRITTSRSIRARPIRSSTALPMSTPGRARTRGGGCWASWAGSPSACLRRGNASRRRRSRSGARRAGRARRGRRPAETDCRRRPRSA